MTTLGAVVPLFKSFEDLQADATEAHAECVAELADARDTYEVAKVAIAEGLNKRSNLPAVLARALDQAVARGLPGASSIREGMYDLQGRIDVLKAETAALKKMQDAQIAALTKRNARLHGVGETARRSHRFAKAHSRPYYGPGATVLAIEAKRDER